MGYGVPAAVAAKAVHPDRIVVSWNGDGCFMMNGQELATAVQYGLPIIFVVVNNGMYGTIRMHQERTTPAACSARSWSIPISRRWRAPTAAWSAGRSHRGFTQAFDEAVASGLPSIIELAISPEALTPVKLAQRNARQGFGRRGLNYKSTTT